MVCALLDGSCLLIEPGVKTMPARINHNVHLRQVHRQLAVHQADVSKQIGQLSSGRRVNRSSDDPASLALADGINSEVRAIVEGQRNIQQTFSLLQVADGSLDAIGGMINRMLDLSMQGASSVFNDADRLSINSEFEDLKQEIDRIAGATTYNGKELLNGFVARIDRIASSALADVEDTGALRVRLTDAIPGTYVFLDDPDDGTLTLGNGVLTQTLSVPNLGEDGALAIDDAVVLGFESLGIEVTLGGGRDDSGRQQYIDGELAGKTLVVEGISEFTFQVGPAETSNDVTTISIADMRSSGPGLNLESISIQTIQDAQNALSALRQAQSALIDERNRIGAFQNRLQLSLNTGEAVMERMQATEANIREVDIARGITMMTQSQILAEAATSIAVSADADIDRILSLLR